MFLLLAGITSAALVLESQYLSSKCSGHPDVMYAFTVSDTSAYAPGVNETWAPMYAFTVNEYSIGLCGNLIVPSTNGCCYNSLDLTASNGYQSATMDIIPDDQQAQISGIVPFETNGAVYCHLAAQASNASSTLLGYSQVFVNSNDVCIDGQFKCSSIGLLEVYAGSRNCSGIPEKLQLSQLTRNYQTKTMGNITGSLLTFSGASRIFAWEAYTPSTLLVPSFQDPSEIISLVCFIIAIIVALIMVVQTAFRLLPFKGWIMATFISQVLWLVWVSMRLAYWMKIFVSLFELAVWVEIIFAMLAFTTLLTTLITSKFIATVLVNHMKNYYQLVIYFVPVILHVCLAGSYYIIYYAIYSQTGISVEYSMQIRQWTTYFIYWIWSMLIWNCTPPILVALRLVNRGDDSLTLGQKISKLHSIDSTLLISLVFQLFIFISFFVLGFIRTQTAILGSDRAYVACQGFEAILLVLHSAMCVRVAQTVKVVCSAPHYAFTDSKKGSKKGSASATTGSTTSAIQNTPSRQRQQVENKFIPFSSPYGLLV